MKNSGIQKQFEERKMQRQRGEKTLAILEALSHGALAISDLLMAFAPGATYQYVRTSKRRHEKVSQFFNDERERNTFYSLLSYLKKQRLVSKNNTGQWRITDNGRTKKAFLQRYRDAVKGGDFPIPIYSLEPSGNFIFIIFDIPEREKRKRDWLRQALKNMNFIMVQKSVWTASILLPELFISHLKELDILECVKIFSAIQIGNV